MTNRQLYFLVTYFILLIVCLGLLITADSLSFRSREIVMPIAADSFKLVLGAIIGALSTMLGASSKDTVIKE